MHEAGRLTPRRELAVLLTLAGVQFTHILDFMIMMPLGPQLTQMFAITDAQFGLLVSAYTLAAGVSGLAAATYLDRFDRKKLLLVLYLLFGLATLACGLAPDYPALMLARVMAGVFGGVLSATSQTIVADVVPFQRRGQAMGIVMTSFSVSTVAGVPLGLFLAAHFTWHMPFFGIAALVGLLTLVAHLALPTLADHLRVKVRTSVWGGIRQVLADANHLRAFALSALLMFAAFTVIPFITIFMQANVGWPAERIPWIYLSGGVATLVTSRLVGVWSDRLGKFEMFRLMALVVVLPLVGVTMTQGLPVPMVLLITTLFFIFMNGRMVPGMALVTSAAYPPLRGTFMALNGSIQSASMGLASLLGGLIISRDSAGLVQNYWVSGLVGACASLLAIRVATRLRLHGAASE